MGQSILVFLLPDYLLPGTPCFRSLPRPFFHTLQLSDFALRGYLRCGIFVFACLLYRLLVNVPFCYYMCLLHRRIYWLLTLIRPLSLVLFSLSLP
jgi:hypothetical protein